MKNFKHICLGAEVRWYNREQHENREGKDMSPNKSEAIALFIESCHILINMVSTQQIELKNSVAFPRYNIFALGYLPQTFTTPEEN